MEKILREHERKMFEIVSKQALGEMELEQDWMLGNAELAMKALQGGGEGGEGGAKAKSSKKDTPQGITINVGGQEQKKRGKRKARKVSDGLWEMYEDDVPMMRAKRNDAGEIEFEDVENG